MEGGGLKKKTVWATRAGVKERVGVTAAIRGKKSKGKPPFACMNWNEWGGGRNEGSFQEMEEKGKGGKEAKNNGMGLWMPGRTKLSY